MKRGWITPLPGRNGLRGTRQSSNGSSGTTPPFAEVLNTAEAWVIGEADQQVRLKLDQRLLLEGEGFQADLTLANQLAGQSADDITVNLLISDTNDVLVNSSFIITPVVPTLLTDTLPAGEQVLGSWLIVPTASVTDTAGKTYYAAAEITYELGGTSYTFTTLPEQFTVLPAPELAVEYRLPDPTYTCSIFDLEATVYNTGVGPARGVSLSSGQPRLVESTNGDPQNFRIIGVSVDGQPSSTLALDQSLGDIPAGQNRRIVWRMESTKPGRFVEFTSGFHRIQDYAGLPLVAPRLTISTTFTTPSNPFLYGCLTGDFNITGKVQDEKGNPVTDVVFAVGYASPDGAITDTTIITPLMDASGAYTIPDVTAGTYTLTPIKLEDLNSSSAFREKPLPPYAITPAALGSAQTTPPAADDTFEICRANILELQSFGLILSADPDVVCAIPIPTIREPVVPATDPGPTPEPGVGDSENNDFTMPTPPDLIPPNTGFKGANWLRYLEDNREETGTNYRQRGIHWDLETADTIDIDIGLYQQLPRDNRVPGLGDEVANFVHPDNGEGVYTIIRLQTPPPPDPALLPCNIQWEGAYLGQDGLLTEDFTQELENCDGVSLSAYNDLIITAPVAGVQWRIEDTGNGRTYIVGRSEQGLVYVYDSPYYYGRGDDASYDRHNRERTCGELNNWMETLDAEVESIINHPNIVEADPQPIPIFILGNEP